MTARYGAWRGGPDPLAPPYDIREALDELGDDVLAGLSPRCGAEPAAAPRRRRPRRAGRPAAPGPRTRPRAAQLRPARPARSSGSASCWTRPSSRSARALFPDPGDAARMAEAELDALPGDTARAVRQLADYQWRSPEARQTYEQIKELLRDEVLDAQFAGLRQALQNATSAGHAAHPGDDARAQRDARRRRARRAHPAAVRRVHAALRRVLPRPSGQPRRADRLAGPAGRRRPAADGVAHPRPACRARVADGPGARRLRAGRGDGSSAAGAAVGAAGPAVERAHADGRRQPHRVRRRDRCDRRAGRPRPARASCSARTIRAPASTTSTRS